MFIPVLAMESCDRACVGSFAFDVAVFQRFGDKIHNNAKSPITSDKETFYFILFYFRELTSTIAKLESLVQREVENLKENIIKLDKEITRLEEIKNDAIILR